MYHVVRADSHIADIVAVDLKEDGWFCGIYIYVTVNGVTASVKKSILGGIT